MTRVPEPKEARERGDDTDRRGDLRTDNDTDNDTDNNAADADETLRWKRGWPLFKRFWPFIRTERRTLVVVAILSLIGIPAGVFSPLLIQRVFDEALSADNHDLLIRLGAAILAFTLGAHVLHVISDVLVTRSRNRVRHRLSKRLFEHVLRLPLKRLHRMETGYVMARLKEDIAALNGLMGDALLNAVIDLARAVLFFALLLRTDWQLAGSGLALLLVIFVGVALASRPLRRRSEAAQEAEAVYSSSLHQAITGALTVRASSQERAEGRRISRGLKGAVRAAGRREVLHVWFMDAIGLAMGLGMYVILLVGAWLILKGESTVGSLMAFSIYLSYVGGAVTSVFGMYPEIQRGLASLARIFKLLDDPQEGGDGPRRGGATLGGRVTFDRVTFAYDDGTEALSGVSLDVSPGEVLAIVGRSGAGKSTLIHLIPRLYDPTAGQVRMDGVPLEELPLATLREQIGVVPQDVFLFHRTIRENIAYARPDASDEEVRSAARAAHADGFIDAMENGYDTIVGERGVKLSGGQRQRIAIAREVLRDPVILILDEATSSLDSESEALIKQAFDQVKRDRTCFVIAHRLSTVVDADRIVVLERGKIAEIGTHAELMEQGAIYRGLYDTQFSRRTEGEIDSPATDA